MLSLNQKRTIIKLFVFIIISEVVFIFILKTILTFVPYEDQEFIYIANINVFFLITLLCWLNLRYSIINRSILIIFGIWSTIMTLYALFFLLSSNFSVQFNYLNYHILDIFSITYRLFFTIFIFLWSIKPNQDKVKIIFYAFISSLMISSSNYLPIFITKEYLESYIPLFSKDYNLQILNFALLIIFWHQYTQTKVILSEYLSSILSVYTIIVGLEIFHTFSYQNNLIFHYFSQFFMIVLYILIAALLLLRLIYLLSPESKVNEKYIENYELLRGVVNKPRKSLIIEFYSNINRITIFIFIGVFFFLGGYLLFFNKFIVFIKLNVLFLIISVIVSITLAIITWHKRWYDAVGIFFKKSKSR